MDPGEEHNLRHLVRGILAAQQGMVIVLDLDSARLELATTMEELLLADRIVPVEELIKEDVEQFFFIESLEALTKEWPDAFVITPSERVRAFLEER